MFVSLNAHATHRSVLRPKGIFLFYFMKEVDRNKHFNSVLVSAPPLM
jgi:hypothetical protein